MKLKIVEGNKPIKEKEPEKITEEMKEVSDNGERTRKPTETNHNDG